MPKPYPREFRDDVVRVARNRDAGVTVEQIAKDFGVHPMTLFKWLRQADVEDGAKPGVSRSESAELRELQPRATPMSSTDGSLDWRASTSMKTALAPRRAGDGDPGSRPTRRHELSRPIHHHDASIQLCRAGPVHSPEIDLVRSSPTCAK